MSVSFEWIVSESMWITAQTFIFCLPDVLTLGFQQSLTSAPSTQRELCCMQSPPRTPGSCWGCEVDKLKCSSKISTHSRSPVEEKPSTMDSGTWWENHSNSLVTLVSVQNGFRVKIRYSPFQSNQNVKCYDLLLNFNLQFQFVCFMFVMQISVDELESSISVKISNEAVMSINSPESLFTSVNGKLVTKVYIAALPNRTETLIKPVSTESLKNTHTTVVQPGNGDPVLTSQPASNYPA